MWIEYVRADEPIENVEDAIWATKFSDAFKNSIGDLDAKDVINPADIEGLSTEHVQWLRERIPTEVGHNKKLLTDFYTLLSRSLQEIDYIRERETDDAGVLTQLKTNIEKIDELISKLEHINKQLDQVKSMLD